MSRQHRVCIGLIGAGFMGATHAMGYLSASRLSPSLSVDVELRGVADVNQERALDATNQFGFEYHTDDYRTLLADEQIEIVSVAAPNNLHEAIVLDAVDAGKSILCEKPLARDETESARMLAAVSDRSLVHGVNFNYRRVPAVATAKALLARGVIGEPLFFRGWYLQDYALDESLPWNWKFSREKSGSGSLAGIGSHVIDLARWMMGEIVEVVGETRTVVQERRRVGVPGTTVTVDVDDQVFFLLRFLGGGMGSIEASRCSSGYKNSLGFEIQGREGSVQFDYERPGELRISHSRGGTEGRSFETYRPGPKDPYGELVFPLPAIGVGFSDIMAIQVYEFLEAVIGRSGFEPDFEDGHRVCSVCDAVLASAETRSWKKVQGCHREKD